MRLYSIYRSAACDAEDRLPYHGSGPCMRRRRDPGGRFSTHVEITSLASYVELAPGESVSREMRLDLDERRGWKRHLEVGKEYWLRYDGWNGSGLGRHWRFGKLTVCYYSWLVG